MSQEQRFYAEGTIFKAREGKRERYREIKKEIKRKGEKVKEGPNRDEITSSGQCFPRHTDILTADSGRL